MKYYIDTIEQTRGEDSINEYGSRERVSDEKTALTRFYQKLASASNSETHIYMDIKIVNSEGGIIKKDKIGEYSEN